MHIAKPLAGLALAVTTAAIMSGGQAHAESTATTVQVQAGDSLSNIAAAHDTTYQRLFDANTTIQDPNVIHAGDTIRIPGADEQIPNRTLSSAPAAAPSTTNTPPIAVVSDDVWDKLAQCESGGNWQIDTGNGYGGGLQISQATWNAHGGSGNPASASREQQIAVAQGILASQGWNAWPACSAQLGLQ